MIKKILTLLTVLVLCAACAVTGFFILDIPARSTAEENTQPGVMVTDGRIVDATSRIKNIEGKISKLTKKEMHVMIQGVEWKLVLTEEIRDEIQKMNEKGIEIKKGTYVSVFYEVVNDDRVVTRVLRLVSNK